MSYIAPIHRPSSIRQAISARLWPKETVLVTAKVNRIEISRANADGLMLLSSAVVCGSVTFLQSLKPNHLDTDVLFIGTDQFHYFIARWDPETRKLVTEQIIEDIAEPYMRDAQSQNQCAVDPKGRYMAIHLWEGVMNVMKLGVRKGSHLSVDRDWAQVRLSELFIKGSTFVPTETGNPTIAMLYQSAVDREDAKLAVYRLMSNDQNTAVSRFEPAKDREIDLDIPDPYARILIPVTVVESSVKRYHRRDTTGASAQLGGLIIVGETLLLYVDTLTKSKVTQALDEPKIFVAWAEYDVTHYFIADDYGYLYLLTIEVDDVVVTGMSLKRLGKTSRAACLVYMRNKTLFLGSHHGDSQLYAFDDSEQAITLIQTAPNIAPIMDFSIMDLGNAGDSQVGNAFSSGQARIVTGSGVHQNGSLRSVRSSVGLEDIGIFDGLQSARGLFSLHSHGSLHVDTLVASFLTETRVFKFDDVGGIEELFEFQGLVFDQPTLLAASLPGGHTLQITSSAATLLDSENGVAMNTWNAPEGQSIVSASANDNWALLSVSGTTLVVLNLTDDFASKERSMGSLSDQISCIHVSPDVPNIGVVGFWSTGSVSIVDLTTLEAIHGETIKQDDSLMSIPRDLALVQLHEPSRSGPTLFISLEDGQVVSLDVSRQDYSLSNRKSITLGNSHTGLHVLPHSEEEGRSNVFAATEYSSLIYSSEGRIIYSAVTAENITYIAPFDSEAFPDTVFLATDQNVQIAHIDPERRTHVNPLHIGETVRRVAYSSALRVFGIGTIKKELNHNEETITSSFQLVDEIVLGQVGKQFALGGAMATEIVEEVIRAELPDNYGELAERFIVGTSYLTDQNETQGSDVRGRILVLGVDSDKNPYLLASHELKGACRCLGTMEGDKIVAGLSKTIVVYQYAEESTTTGKLLKLATFRPSTFPVDIDVKGNIIGVADLMQSMTLIEFVPAAGGKKPKLVEQARHFEHVWATTVACLDGNQPEGEESSGAVAGSTWLEADAQGNLMVLERNLDGATEHDRKQMRCTSEIHLGEQVNKIQTVQVEAAESDIIRPKAFLGTVDGSIYMHAEISAGYQNLLLLFQERLAGAVRYLGQGISSESDEEAGSSFKAWRGFRNAKRAAEGPFRFVDGELIERFLDLNELRQEAVVEGLGPTVEAMRNMVEELKRMH